jgi:hypothetical protein
MPETFAALYHRTRGKGLLADNRCVSVEEQIAMFLAVVTRNESNRAISERFQHSGKPFTATSTLCFRRLLTCTRSGSTLASVASGSIITGAAREDWEGN